jgi:Domain of unknown function (DUF5615)
VNPLLRYLLDEQLRRVLWSAVQKHNHLGLQPLDVTRVGDPADLPLGSQDPDILRWAEREDRILVSLDKKTIPGHFAAHLATGHHSPGVFLIRPAESVRAVLSYLVLAAYASDPSEHQDVCKYIPV